MMGCTVRTFSSHLQWDAYPLFARFRPGALARSCWVFPTRLPKQGHSKQFHPTISARIRPNCASRWGVPRACAAKSRKSSNDADFRRWQSLHICTYRNMWMSK